MNGHREILVVEPQSLHHQGAADDLAEPWETGQVLTAKKHENGEPGEGEGHRAGAKHDPGEERPPAQVVTLVSP